MNVIDEFELAANVDVNILDELFDSSFFESIDSSLDSFDLLFVGVLEAVPFEINSFA